MAGRAAARVARRHRRETARAKTAGQGEALPHAQHQRSNSNSNRRERDVVEGGADRAEDVVEGEAEAGVVEPTKCRQRWVG